MGSVHQRKFWLALATASCLFTVEMSARPAQAATFPTIVRSAEQGANPNLIEVQRRRLPRRSYYVSRHNDWVGPAIMLGVIGAIAASQQYQYYSGAPYGYYQQPYNYYSSQPYVYSPPNGLRRCYVVTDDARNYGYWGWCR